MKNIFFINSLLFILISNVAFSQTNADSAFVHHQILNGVDSAQYIFEGEVLYTTGYFNSSQSYIYTSNTMRVHQVWKNDSGKPILAGEIVEIATHGGKVGNQELRITHNLSFTAGQKGMFLCDLSGYPANNNSITPQAKKLQVFDGLYFDYDFSKHYISSSYARFDFECIDLLYRTIDSTHVVECLDVYPNGILQFQKYSQLMDLINQKAQSVSGGGNAILTYTFENAGTVSVGNDDFFEFDVYLSSSTPGFFDTAILRIDYNPLAFGTNVSINNNVTVQRRRVNGFSE